MSVPNAAPRVQGPPLDIEAGPRRRAGLTRWIAGFMAVSALMFGVFTVVFGIVAESQQIHGFHNAVVASLLLILSAPPAFAIARNPVHSEAGLISLTVLSGAALVTMAAALTVDPFTLPFVLFTGVLWIVRPAKGRPKQGERSSLSQLALVAIGAVPLIVYAMGQAELQRVLAGDVHSQFFHWVEVAFYATAILFLASASALRPRTQRLAGLSAGAGLTIFGLAALFLGGRASAVAAHWAWLATVGGIVFIGLVARSQAARSSAGDDSEGEGRPQDSR